MKELKDDVKQSAELGIPDSDRVNYATKGWHGKLDQGDVAVFEYHATIPSHQVLERCTQMARSGARFSNISPAPK